MKRINLFLLFFSFSLLSFAQKKEYKITCLGFYNLENLFDTLNTPGVRDREFTPKGRRIWGTKLYNEKLGNLAKVISELGTEMTPDGVAMIGVAEIENRLVLEDLVKHPIIADRNYKIIHYDSPDKRGIDVALLYQEKYFNPTASRPVKIDHVKPNGDTLFTRDVLFVSGELDGDPIHVLVNHWPSRRGGEKATAPLRNLAAMYNRNIVDSLQQVDPKAKVFVMGDMNDDPVSPSMKDILRGKNKKEKVKKKDMFNPYMNYYKKGFGSNAYRDAWSLFDQIVMSPGVLKDDDGYYFYKSKIYNKRYLIQKTGQYKGYPYRTFSGDSYAGGYSDHFPVFVYLIKEK